MFEENVVKFTWKFGTQKSGYNMYFDFEVKFGAFSTIIFRHGIYCFESWEVRSLILQIVCKSKLEWRSYVCWKRIGSVWVRVRHFSFTYELEIDLELTQILNSTLGDRVLNAFIHFEMYNTHLELVIFLSLLSCLWIFFVISGQWKCDTF